MTRTNTFKGACDHEIIRGRATTGKITRTTRLCADHRRGFDRAACRLLPTSLHAAGQTRAPDYRTPSGGVTTIRAVNPS
jgi:hypothetical protein